MSEADRNKWDERYADGAYAERVHASAYLLEWLPKLPRGRALDLACGAGRNALALAAAGYVVDAIDISPVALGRAHAAAAARGLTVRFVEADLEAWAPPSDTVYTLIICFRYVNLPLLAKLPALLAPGGTLLVEQHMSGVTEVAGPRDPAYRVAPGALAQAVSGLDVLECREEVVVDLDGRQVALARLAARRPLPEIR